MARRLLSPFAMRAKQSNKRRAGVTAIEMMVAIAVVGLLTAAAVPSFEEWQQNMHIKAAARKTADALLRARSEAIRTGNVHVAFLQTTATPPALDPCGLNIPTPILVIDDGPLGTANCCINPNENVFSVPATRDVNWGFSLNGGLLVPSDSSGGGSGNGSTLPIVSNTTAVAFRPDGIPVSLNGVGCNFGPPGSGTGGIYLTNGLRDYAVVLSPLGGVRVHAWNAGQGAWEN